MNTDEHMIEMAWPYLRPYLDADVWDVSVYHEKGCPQRPCRCSPEIEFQRQGDARPLLRLVHVGDTIQVEMNDAATH